MASRAETLMKLELQLADAAFRPIRSLQVELEECRTGDRWFRYLLTCLVHATLREYFSLKIGYRHSTAFLSWACRNLLELSIFAKYISLSEENVERFAGDRIIDGIELFESFETWSAHVDPQRHVPELDQILTRLRTQKTNSGLTATKSLRAEAIAKSVGMGADFKHMNKVCSKAVHPTAWSVLTPIDEGELKGLRSVLLHSGVNYGLQIYTTFRSHIDKYGVKPA